jgi:predicted O-linked N-acetylglucosamine transferase (SPINDLY family)
MVSPDLDFSDHGAAYAATGNAQVVQGRFEDAVVSYRRALEINPGDIKSFVNLGNVLSELGRKEEAITAYRQVIDRNPGFVGAYHNLGHVLLDLDRAAEAIEVYRRALRADPDHPMVLADLGVALYHQNKHDEAIACYRRALEANPGDAEIHYNLGVALAKKGALDEAIASYREALRLNPDSAETRDNLANTYLRRGELDEALACYREACRLGPKRAAATYSNLLFSLNYHPAWTPQAIFEEHRHWGETYAPRPEKQPAHGNSREPERRLRIGYVSADFREHSVAFFIEPVLTQHDRERFEIYCYAQVAAPDAVTGRLKQLAAHWRPIVGLDDRQAADRIRADKIDILVDLSGHTAGNRLGVFAHRPAPVQASFIGYPNTTGLPAMDYRIVNPWIAPPGSEVYFTEKLVYLPSPPCFRPAADCPPVNVPPALDSGRVTFGCFNNLAKLAPPVIALWAAVLQAVSGSRLMLKSQPFNDAGTRDLFHARFAAHGVGPERLLLRGSDPLREYLRCFNDVDIALDPFPYNGGTTTYHALWMGVPVVALEGRNSVSRIGYGVLATLGLKELAAKTPADYVTIAAGLAADPGRLQALRASLRERMRASPLTDGKRYTAALEKLYRDIWGNWCVNTK